jgi:23S rRNA pseudouridine2605 synthase
MSDDNEENDGNPARFADAGRRDGKAASGQHSERDGSGNGPVGTKSRHRKNRFRDRKGAREDASTSAVGARLRPGFADASPPAAPGDAGERISKVISRAGVASRRDVERMIGEGRIMLNGETVTTPVLLVKPSDRIFVDGAPLPVKERTRLFLYHKPPGLVTTEKDPEGRATVFAALPEGLPRVVSVGRLDLNTEGLLLLTNDGGLARLLAHPKTGWLRRYRVRAFGEITQSELDGLKDGIEIDGMHYGPVEAKVDREQGSNMWLTLGLREGKNREVKRILEHFGLKVNRLIRVSFGPFQLGELEQGAAEEVRTRTLKDQLGPELAREAKVDFSDETASASPRDATQRRESTRHGERERRRAQAPHGEEAHQRRGSRPDPAGREPRDRDRPFNKRDRISSDRPVIGRLPEKRGDADEARALRKAQAIAQGRRSAAHRHSWRDAESWAARGERKSGAQTGTTKRPHRPFRAGEPAKPDERRHVRGGRIADRKGRSVLVERVAPDPAAAAHHPASGEARRSADRTSPPRDTDVLRRKSRREQGLAGPPRDKFRASRPAAKSRTDTWKARGGDRPASRFDHRPGDERPSRHEGEGRQNRDRDRPWRREKIEGSRARSEGNKARHEGFGRDKRSDQAKPRQDRAEHLNRLRERPEISQAQRERVEGFKPRRERPGGFKPRSEREHGFGPRGSGPRRTRPGHFQPRPPRPDRPPRKPPR